jgi:hypothetical protein
MPGLLTQPSGARQATDPNLLLQPGGPPGSFVSSYQPATGERISQGINNLLQGVGISPFRAGQIGGGAESLWNMTPMAAAEDAGYLGGSGNKTGAAIAALGAIPGAKPETEAARSELARLKAYHGSPHSFDQFDLSKIGTGEGAQAYGHGLYFAEKEGIAKSYRDALSNVTFSHPKYGDNLSFDRVENGLKAAMYGGSTLDDVNKMDTIAANVSEGMRMGIDLDPANFVAHDAPIAEKDAWAAALNRAKEYNVQHKGHMYEVNINADPSHMLDYDKPISQQSESVRSALGNVPWAEPYLKSSALTGGQIVPKTPEGAAQLQQAGIPGIKYLDAGSRSASEGSRNYVVFDPKIIDIVRKYGIAGAIAAGALTAEQARQLSGQQGNQQWLQQGGT